MSPCHSLTRSSPSLDFVCPFPHFDHTYLHAARGHADAAGARPGAAAGAEQEPDQEPDDGEEEDEQRPEHLHERRVAAAPHC